MKYYWLSYVSNLTKSYREIVINNQHPFEWMNEWIRGKRVEDYTLVNWREITKEEFDIFYKFEPKITLENNTKHTT